MAKKIVNFEVSDSLENTDFSITKVRITTMVDKDILDWLKQEANKTDRKYQTILNAVLRQAMGKNPDKIKELENRVRRLERKIS